MNTAIVVVSMALYLSLLFGIAAFIDRRKTLAVLLSSSPYVYSLSLAVYCTGWTYFGSVGRAASGSLDFLTIYLGPTLVAVTMPVVYKKMLRISKSLKINTVSDFITTRYGKGVATGNLVALLTVLGIVPYIALQIRAISLGYQAITAYDTSPNPLPIVRDPALYLTALLGLFTVLFATRRIATSEKNDGLVVTIAFESLIKLLAFLIVGLFVTFYAFEPGIDGQLSDIERYFSNSDTEDSTEYFSWFAMMVFSALAFLMLPRQFEMGIVENDNEGQLDKAAWLFPLYLMLINLFVVPIAAAGNKWLPDQNAELYILSLPMKFDMPGLALFTFIGGFSAATGMIIVSTAALSRMLSNNILIPAFIRNEGLKKLFPAENRIPIYTRRFSIIAILALAFLYYRFLSGKYSLVSIGLISFAAVSQFAVSAIGGMYWKQANKRGAIGGLIAGFFIWFYILLLPSFVSPEILKVFEAGLASVGLGFLSPQQFMGMSNISPIGVAFFWSMLFNVGLFIVLSLRYKPDLSEVNQAEIFTQIFKYGSAVEQSVVWKGSVKVRDVRQLLDRFLGKHQTDAIIRQFVYRYNDISVIDDSPADARLVNYAEKSLAAVIGSSSARLLISSIAREEKITLDEVVEILKESQELIRLNKELRRASEQLQKATTELQKANKRLREQDERKDEFLYTVTHELRTPLTAIKSLVEILCENQDLPDDLRQQYLTTISRETDRMSRLIAQVLDLENFESGKHKLEIDKFDISEVIQECVHSLEEIFNQKKITIRTDLARLPDIWGDRDRITQVILNLLSNAIKHCPPEKGEIFISGYVIDNQIKINISDNGPGVKPELRQVIFEKFYQAPNQTIRKPKGSGLGLAISKKIIQLHHGRIWVEDSDQLPGARFCITLPIHFQHYE
ncbi:MAG: ATP-binding protein [Thermaurantimonas sp.]|uniref:ATP-binding protein n=1 Tax=Thermaurantimonas sp. TaxID=2681568 RepID=UPI00391C4B61